MGNLTFTIVFIVTIQTFQIKPFNWICFIYFLIRQEYRHTIASAE